MHLIQKKKISKVSPIIDECKKSNLRKSEKHNVFRTMYEMSNENSMEKLSCKTRKTYETSCRKLNVRK